MKNKIIVALIITLSLSTISLFLYLVIKNIDYRAGIEGRVSVHGTYEATIDKEPTRFTLNEDENTYYHFTNNDQVIQSGKFEEVGTFLVLYSENTQIIYGKIIKSYNKIYFVNSNLSISTYEKILDVLWIPKSAPVQKKV